MAKAWSRRSRMTCLGDSGLPVAQAGHCDWHRPHSVQVAMSSRPFQVKSSIFPSPNTSVSGSASSKSSTLPLLRIGSSGPSAFGRRENMTFKRRERDVQVLGVDHDHRERHDHGDLGQDEHHLQHAVHPVAQRGQPVPDDLGGERAVRVGEHPGVDLRAPVDQQRGDDQEDHPEHDPGGAGVRAEEPGLAAFLMRVVPDPDDGEGDDPGQHADGEQVLDEPDERPSARCRGWRTSGRTAPRRPR